MKEKMTKAQTLEAIRREREALKATLEPLSQDQMVEAGVEGHWSVKDILCHISAWENRMVQWLAEALGGEVPEMPGPGLTWDDMDRLNEQSYLANKDRALDDVLAESEGSYQRGLEAVQELSDEILTDPDRFEWMGGATLGRLVGANTWWHYRDHHGEIRKWLDKAG